MDATKTKVAYASFFVSFGIWLALVISVCFPGGKWASPIRFPDMTALTLFLASGIASSIACMIIGLDHLGVTMKPQNGRQNSGKAISLGVPVQTNQSAAEANRIDNSPSEPQMEQSQECLETIVIAPEEDALVVERPRESKAG